MNYITLTTSLSQDRIISENRITFATVKPGQFTYTSAKENLKINGLPGILNIKDTNNNFLATIAFDSSLINIEFCFKLIEDTECLKQVFKNLKTYVYPTDFYK